MLTRVYVDNFRCFVNFEFKPSQKQLLLGANGSGKSSLLEVIRYVQAFVDGEENCFTQSTRTRWLDNPFQVVEIDALLDAKKYEYRVEIHFVRETKELSVHLESLAVDGLPVFEFSNGDIHFFFDDGRASPLVPFEASLSALRLAQLSNAHVRRFVDWLKSVHCFKIDAYPKKMDEITDNEEKYPDYEVENIAGWYRYLLSAYPDENADFVRSLRTCLNGFRNLRFYDEDGGIRGLRAEFISPAKENVRYAFSELSDGQRCLIALYMILHFTIGRGETVFIDEPDNYIALREIQPWLMAASEQVEDHGGQLILISHHPELLNQWASAYGLNFFREGNGHVRTEEFRSDPDGLLVPAELVARGWDLV